jgi:hypothetical protein
MNVGITIAKLSNANRGKRTMRIGGIIMEGFAERYGKDPDIDTTKTASNIYQNYSSGKMLLADINNEMKTYNTEQRKQGKRGLRVDAVPAFALIVKPPADIIETWDDEKRRKYWRDTDIIMYDFMGKANKTGRNKSNIRASVIHKDELGEHKHYYGMCYTSDGRISGKDVINLKLFSRFNSEYSKRMRALGWDISDCSTYDFEATKNMSEEEKAEYKKQHIEKKKLKKHGQTSETYKAEQEAKKQQEIILTDEEKVKILANRKAEIDRKEKEEQSKNQTDKYAQFQQENEEYISRLIANNGGVIPSWNDVQQQANAPSVNDTHDEIQEEITPVVIDDVEEVEPVAPVVVAPIVQAKAPAPAPFDPKTFDYNKLDTSLLSNLENDDEEPENIFEDNFDEPSH